MFKREKRIERRTCAKALKELQVPNIPLKLLLGTNTGWPDRLFLLGGGAVLFIEFKDPNGKVAPMQVYMIELLRGMGYEVQVHDSEQAAIHAIAKAKISSEAGTR